MISAARRFPRVTGGGRAQRSGRQSPHIGTGAGSICTGCTGIIRICLFQRSSDFMEELKQEGKIRFYGASNFPRERMDEAVRYARENGIQGFSAVSNQWSIASVNPGKKPEPGPHTGHNGRGVSKMA